MIGKIAGRVDYIAEDHVLIEAMGVGYEVYCSNRTLAGLPGVGEVAAVYTQLLVREDLLQLFGFATREEREWHRLLTSVQGVGAKVGLALLGTLGPEGAARAITLGDAAAVKATPGVGPKLAQRIVNELKGKAPALMAMGGGASASAEAPVIEDVAAAPAPKRKPKKVDAEAVAAASARADAMSALVNLGYGEGDAAMAVAQAEQDGLGGSAEALIRAGLKALAPK